MFPLSGTKLTWLPVLKQEIFILVVYSNCMTKDNKMANKKMYHQTLLMLCHNLFSS